MCCFLFSHIYKAAQTDYMHVRVLLNYALQCVSIHCIKLCSNSFIWSLEVNKVQFWKLLKLVTLLLFFKLFCSLLDVIRYLSIKVFFFNYDAPKRLSRGGGWRRSSDRQSLEQKLNGWRLRASPVKIEQSQRCQMISVKRKKTLYTKKAVEKKALYENAERLKTHGRPVVGGMTLEPYTQQWFRDQSRVELIIWSIYWKLHHWCNRFTFC